MKTFPLPFSLPPLADDVALLNFRRAVLDCKLAAHAARESRIVAGNASPETIDWVLRDRHLSRVLAGPRPIYQAPALDDVAGSNSPAPVAESAGAPI